MRKLALVILALLSLTSCVHKSPFVSEYYFQAMGRDSELVMTVDMEKAKESASFESLTDNAIGERSSRISIALEPEEDNTLYPLPLDAWSIYGAAEGNFGTILVPMALKSMDGFSEVKEEGAKYYTNGSLSVGVPRTGVLLFATSDYLEAKNRTIDNREILISNEIADNMASELFSIYVKSPRTMIDLGFDLPYAVLSAMDYALISISEEGGIFYLSANIAFESARSAQTFTTLMRNMVVQEIRRAGGKFDMKALSEMVYQDEYISVINRKEMKTEDVAKYFDMASSLSGGII